MWYVLQPNVGLWNYWSYEIGQFFTRIAWIVSGCLLVWAIWSIKSFLKARSDDGHGLNIKQLWLHASIFGLFVGSLVIYEVSYLIEYTLSFVVDEGGKAFLVSQRCRQIT